VYVLPYRGIVRQEQKYDQFCHIESQIKVLIFFYKNRYLSRMNKEYFKILNHIYCWGDVQKDAIEKAYGHNEKINLTAHPRFDLVKKKYRVISSESFNSNEYSVIEKLHLRLLVVSNNWVQFRNGLFVNEKKKFDFENCPLTASSG